MLLAGTGRAVITPPVGYMIAGPEHSSRRSRGITDDLLARVLVLEAAGQRCAIVTLDTWGIASDLADTTRKRIAEVARVEPSFVWIGCAGNATSPPLWRREPGYDYYADYLPELISGASAFAVEHLAAAAVGTGTAKLPGVSTSVSGPGEDVDETLTVLAVDDEHDRGLARMYNFACPAAVMGQTDEWTADYPGFAAWATEQSGEGLGMFVQGPSADVRPFDWWEGNPAPSHAERGPADVQALGLLLATQVASAGASAVRRRNVTFGSAVSGSGDVHVLRIGGAVLVSVVPPQPSAFAASIRESLPGSTVIITTNRRGHPYGPSPELDSLLVDRATNFAGEAGAQ